MGKRAHLPIRMPAGVVGWSSMAGSAPRTAATGSLGTRPGGWDSPICGPVCRPCRMPATSCRGWLRSWAPASVVPQALGELDVRLPPRRARLAQQRQRAAQEWVTKRAAELCNGARTPLPP